MKIKGCWSEERNISSCLLFSLLNVGAGFIPARFIRHMRRQIRLPGEDYNRDHPFYLTACTSDRRKWFRDHPVLARECENRLVDLAQGRSSELFAWCVMPDHVHVLIRDHNPIEYMRMVKGSLVGLAREIQAGPGFWQRSFFDRAVRGEESAQEIARYIWANPVRAGLVAAPGEYAWSGSLVWPDWRSEYGRG